MKYEIWTDISSYQNYAPGSNVGPMPINFDAMRDAGIDGVCIRKQSGYYRDVAFRINWAGALAAGLKRTFYGVPFVAYPLERQWQSLTTIKLPDGTIIPFDPTEADAPPWDDIEKKHKLNLSLAIERTLAWHYRFVEWCGQKTRFYTAKYVWQDYYSKKPGWVDDWELVVANYLKDLYGRPLEEAIANALTRYPLCPIGWEKDSNGNAVPDERRWVAWQFSADGNRLGKRLGVHSRDIDISIVRVPETPEEPPGDDLAAVFERLANLHQEQGAALQDLENLIWA